MLKDDNRIEVSFPPPCPTEAAEGVECVGGGRGTEFPPDGLTALPTIKGNCTRA